MIAGIRSVDKNGAANLRGVERAMGDGVKKPQPSEEKNISVVRKSLVTLKPVKAGEPFTADNFGVKRPGTGVSPMAFWEQLGKRADREYAQDETLPVSGGVIRNK